MRHATTKRKKEADDSKAREFHVFCRKDDVRYYLEISVRRHEEEGKKVAKQEERTGLLEYDVTITEYGLIGNYPDLNNPRGMEVVMLHHIPKKDLQTEVEHLVGSQYVLEHDSNRKEIEEILRQDQNGYLN